MSSRVLVTTCSFQDTPGPHHQLLESQGFEIVRERGPLSETKMLELAGEFDAFLCGDDAITRAVLEKSGFPSMASDSTKSISAPPRR